MPALSQLRYVQHDVLQPAVTLHKSPKSALRVLRVGHAEGLAAIEAAWQKLHERIGPRTPFTSPLWNTLWWKHYRSQRLSVRDRLYTHIVRDARDALIAVAPMMLTERPSKGPLRVRVLQFFGADPNITEIRGLICLPENQQAVLEALQQHFAAQSPEWDWVDWGALRWNERSGEFPRLQGAVTSQTPLTNYHLPLPATWEEFRSSRTRNVKESLRKCYNSMKRAGLTPELRVVREPEQCAAAIRSFLALHADRGRAANTVNHPDVFAAQRDRGFLREYVEEMAKRDQLRLFQLHVSGQLVATRIGFVLGDDLYLYYSGYDTAWGKFSVMTTLLAEAIKWAINEGLKNVNLSTGTDVSKLRWSPVATEFRVAVQVAQGWRARLAYAAYHRVRQYEHGSRLSKLLKSVKR